MLEKPTLSEEKIISRVNEAFGLEVLELSFLPLGETAWVYDLKTKSSRFFLKLKKGDLALASLAIPHFLTEQGVKHLLCPVTSKTGQLLTQLDDYGLVLYPFLDADTAMDTGFSSENCKALGKTLKQIHKTNLNDALMSQLRKENFIPPWAEQSWALEQQIMNSTPQDSISAEFYTFWKAHAESINKLINDCTKVGQSLQTSPPDFVLCHGDIHTANILQNKAQTKFWVVDWDETVFAPKERDLMFILLGIGMKHTGSYDETSFFESYGNAAINKLALAYYRLEWVVQEIGEFGVRIIDTSLGEITRQAALMNFHQLFDPHDVLDQAWDALEKAKQD